MSIPKACCLPFLAWHKILACLPHWTSSRSWQCGWYLLCQVLSLLTIEGKGEQLRGSLATKTTALAVVRISIHTKCWKASSPGIGMFCCWGVESIWDLPGRQKHGLLNTWSQREYEVCVVEIKWVRYGLAMRHRQFLLPDRRERSLRKITGSVRISALLWRRWVFPP